MAQLFGFTKTMKIQLHTDESLDLLCQYTVKQYQEAVSFYLEIIHKHLDAIDGDWLGKLENLTHQTKSNLKPKYSLKEKFGKYPSGFRRAAISEAVGQASSWKTRYEKWQEKMAKHQEKNMVRISKGKKEVPFNEHPPIYVMETDSGTSFYKTEYKVLDSHHILLKMFTGSTYIKRKFTLSKPLVVPEGYMMGSPTLVRKNHGWQLHIPMVLPVKGLNLGKVTERVKEENFRMCCVDLGINHHDVLTIQDAEGLVLAVKFISAKQDNHLRKLYLDKIVKKQHQTGVSLEDEKQCKLLWEKISNFNDYIAHKVSKQIVDFADKHGARTIVFEHLDNLQPCKLRKSKRLNRKFAFWVKGRIVKYTKYKSVHIRIVVNRVSPKNTSRRCPNCGNLTIIRYSQSKKYGVSLAHCINCKLHDVNADYVGSHGVGLNFRVKYMT
jgi:putative transposase